MRVTQACIVVLILSLLIVDESSRPFLLRPASANVLSHILPWALKVLKILNFSSIFKALEILTSFLLSNGGRIEIGVEVGGVSIIKAYFDSYGFLNSPSTDSNYTDDFSIDLESAIKFFQKTFHLNVTGQPDNATASLIKLPRCALPDVINGSSTALENSTTTTSFTKWWPEGKKELTYAFSPQNETGLLLKGTFKDAFRRWSEVTRMNFAETTSFNESDIQISFLPLDGNLGVVGGAWVDNTTSRKWDVVLDSDEKWVWPSDNMTDSKELDLETVAMHQIGHVLGLSHSAMEESVMYPFIKPSEKRKVDFAKDDLEKIRQLYSTKSNSSESSPATSPSSEDEGAAAGVGPRWGLVSLGIILLFCF